MIQDGHPKKKKTYKQTTGCCVALRAPLRRSRGDLTLADQGQGAILFLAFPLPAGSARLTPRLHNSTPPTHPYTFRLCIPSAIAQRSPATSAMYCSQGHQEEWMAGLSNQTRNAPPNHMIFVAGKPTHSLNVVHNMCHPRFASQSTAPRSCPVPITTHSPRPVVCRPALKTLTSALLSVVWH